MTTEELLAAELAKIPARVDRGIAHYDLLHGPDGWRGLILEDDFDMNDPCNCVTGQVQGDFWDEFDMSDDFKVYGEAGELGLNTPFPLIKRGRATRYDRESERAIGDYNLALENEWRGRLGFAPKEGD